MSQVVIIDAVEVDIHEDQRELRAGQMTRPPSERPQDVFVRRKDGRLTPLNQFLASIDQPPKKSGEANYRYIPTDHPGAASGGLDGRAVYLSQCHGWIWSEALDSWATQRGNLFSTVEDLHNPEAMNQFLSVYLENSGASVFTVKERDLNDNFAIADNDGEGYTEIGSGFSNGAAGFRDEAPFAYNQNPFNTGTTRKFPATGGSVARWLPEVPVDGHYAIYVSWDSSAENARNAHYRITHPGGVIDRYFDQTVHGSTWQYVENIWMPAGVGEISVELVGDGSEVGRYLSADAVRVGGGYGQIERHGETTDRPRWEEGAIPATQYNGAPSSVYDPFGDGDGSDPSARSRWAAWEHPTGEDSVYLSWHSNACGSGEDCGARGTSTYTWDDRDCGTPSIDGSAELAELIQDEIVSMARVQWDSSWSDRGTKTDCFAENSPNHNPEMPSALVELAFHNNVVDVEFLKEPSFRRDAARAMYRGIVRYFAERDGDTPHFIAEPPVSVALRNSDEGLVASWAPGPSEAPFGDPSVSYLVYRSKDGRSWDNGTAVSGLTFRVSANPYETVHVRIAAVNEGGVSFSSPVVSARRSPNGRAAILIVDAFDRFDKGMLGRENIGLRGLGTVVRMNVHQMNPADTASVMARAVDAVGWPYDSMTGDAFAATSLDGYRLLVWSAGEESTLDETFSTAEQVVVRSFVEEGGALWASGSEILWDLDFKGNTSDKSFAAEVLGAAMAADDANTESVSGEGLFDGLDLDFAFADGAGYPVEYPDALSTSGTVLARYSTNMVAAALHERVALFGFPFEVIVSEAVRQEVASRLITALVPDYEPPVSGDTDVEQPIDTDWVAADTQLDGPGDRVESSGGCGCSNSQKAGFSGWGALAVLMFGAGGRRRSRC